MSNLATIVNNILADSGIDDISVVIGSGTSGYIPVFTATGRTIGDSVINQSGGNVLIGGNIALHAGNFNSYAPTLGGIGASGTWGISITGNADTVDGYHMNQNLLTSSSPTFAGLTSNGSIFVNGVGVFISSSDHQISLRSPDAWTGIEFDDSAGGFDYIWFNGLYQTFAIGGGGSSVLGKKLHIDGGTTIGSNYDSTSVPTNGLNVEGAIQQAGNQVLHAGNFNSYAPTLTGGGASGTWGINITGSSSGISSTTPQLAASVESNSIYVTSPVYTTGQITKPMIFDWYGNYWAIGNIRSGDTSSNGFGISYRNNTPIHVFTTTGLSINGNTALHSGNFNSYAPTLTGGGASGTWGISISGTAGSAGSATTASYVDGTSGGAIRSWDIRTISPSSMSAYRLGFGFTSWNNNSGAPYADYLHLRSYSDGSGGADNLVTFLKSGIGMRIWQQSFGSSSPYSSYADVLLSTNYTSYAPSLTGSGASGTWGISITGNASNTSSISNAVGSSYTWTGAQYFQSNLGGYSGSLSAPPLQAYSTANNSAFMSFHKSGQYAVNMGLDADNVLRIGGWSAAANRWQLDMSGHNTVAGSFRAPIFFDSENTNYYLDPNSTTSLRTVGSWRADSSNWDGEFNGKIQYHASNWYFQAAGEWLFRNSGGTNIFSVNQSGNLSTTNNITAGGAVYSYNWFRTYGNSGWYSQTYGGGWFMEDSTWIRSYGSKPVYVDQFVRAQGSFRVGSEYSIWSTFGTYSSYISRIAYLSFDWDSAYDSYSNHGIASTSRYGSFSDNMSINSYNDINLRIDTNDNDSSSYVRFHHHTTGDNTFSYIGYNADIGQFQMFLAGQFCTNTSGYCYNDGYFSSVYGSGIYGATCDYCALYSISTCGIYITNYGAWMNLNPNYPVFSPPSGECFVYDGNCGNLYIGGNICQNWYSDCKYKENITEIDSALDKIDALRGVEFDWNELGEEEVFKKGHEVGLIAQEVQVVYPQAVREVSKEREDHVVTALVVDYDKFTPLLIQSIKELNAKVDTLKSRIDAGGL